MPCIIRKLDDDQTVIAMVDADIHREDILPSEKGAAYKMKLDAIKCQGKRREDTSRRCDGKPVEAADLIGAEAGERTSAPQILPKQLYTQPDQGDYL